MMPPPSTSVHWRVAAEFRRYAPQTGQSAARLRRGFFLETPLTSLAPGRAQCGGEEFLREVPKPDQSGSKLRPA